MELTKLEQVLDEKIRPGVMMDGGNVEVVQWDENAGNLYLRLVGACVGCPMSTMTLKMGIEVTLKDEFPEIKEVVAI